MSDKKLAVSSSFEHGAVVNPIEETKSVEEEETLPPVSFVKLFRYTTSGEVFLLLVGAVSAIGVGASMPLFSIIFGGLFDDFSDPTKNPEDVGAHYAMIFGYLAGAVFLLSFLQTSCFTIVSERLTLRLRFKFLESVLHQDMEFFDGPKGSKLTSEISEVTVLFKEGTGDKLGQLFQFATMGLVGFGVGAYYSWKVFLVVLAFFPLLAFGGWLMMGVMADATSGQSSQYSKAGSIAEESFQNLRTVVSFGLQDRISARYEDSIHEAEKVGIKKSRTSGFGMGFFMGTYFILYGIVFWAGSIFVQNDKVAFAERYPPIPVNNTILENCYAGATITPLLGYQLGCYPSATSFEFATDADVCACAACVCGCNAAASNDGCLDGGDVILVFFACLIGSMSLGQAVPSITAFMNARTAAAKAYDVIDNKPVINSCFTGQDARELDGDIEFRDVEFRYPSRPDDTIFTSLNLTLKQGQTTALVGGSGCGKSSAIALLQRFYDPCQGAVLFNGVDLRDLNVDTLRSVIATVSQEPVLFATTIRKNISYGLKDRVPSDEEIERACRLANAWDFIQEFDDGLDTFVGEAGSSVSGGQRQRIAIARALVRQADLKILICDEATSALDNESERIVQQALDKLLAEDNGLTTILIAHRLSTVRNADKIVVLGEGRVLEEGTHETLQSRPNGHYSALLAASKRNKRASHKRKSKRGSKRLSQGTDSNSESLSESETDSVHEEVKDKEEDKKEELYKVPISRVFQYSKPEVWYYFPAMFATMINGATFPIFAILFTEITTVFYKPLGADIQDTANLYAVYFTLFAALAAFAQYGQMFFFGVIGEKMTTRVRRALFASYLTQEVGFFDKDENSIGAVTGRLATDAALVKASLAEKLGVILMNVTTLAVGLAIAFAAGWQLTLYLLGLLPLLVVSGAVQMLLMGNMLSEDDTAMAKANQVLQESVFGIRTVTSFQLGPKVLDLYTEYLEGPMKLGTRKGITMGIGFGLGQGVMFATYSLAFFAGSRLMVEQPENYDFQTVMKVFFALVMMGMSMGQVAALAGDVAKSSHAVSNVFRILDRKSEIDYTAPGETGPEEGPITFEHVNFKYPTRDAMVLNDFNITINQGEQFAFCGQSGSGKSSTMGLIQRFYDTTEGVVKFRGRDIRDYSLTWLRESFGVVEQEPSVFNTTVFQNIAYGIPDTQVVPEEELEKMVIKAAKAANAHDFIMEFPDGYDTIVSKNSCSGGQKLRICIARCLIRKPKVFLLDEYSAAVDNVSEEIIQKNIYRIARENNSTVVIVAHRLSTIKDADCINVVHHGSVVEAGRHGELLGKNGPYAKLFKSQNK